MHNTVTKEQILGELSTTRFGHPLTLLEQTTSTNADLRRLAEAGATEGTTVVALSQSGGRGRRGRTFFSPNGGVYLSTLLRPANQVSAELVTCCAAVAVRRAICSLTPLSVGIKWVNDLYIGPRKVCGILAEGLLSPQGKLEGIILGVGINAASTDFPPDLREIATGLGNEGYAVNPATLIVRLLQEWERAYATLHTGDFLEEYRQHSILLGKPVTVVRGNETFPATALAITDKGHLRVSTSHGEEELSSGEVSLRL